MAAARYGVNGVVTGSDTGLPLDATVTVVGNAKPVRTDPAHGDYYKLLPTGTWQLIFSAPGYLDEVVSGVATTWGTPTVLDVALDPVAHGDLAGTVTAPGGAALDAAVTVYALPLDQYVTSVAAPGGVYATTLPYGDYRLEASASGHATVAQQVTVGPVPVTADFVLGAIENLDLFASDFEADMAGWSGGWGLSTGGVGHASSGSLTDSPGVNYADNITNIVTMDQGVDLDDVLTAQLSFWATWAIEPAWDACFCEISVNGGQSWTALATSHTGPASGQGGQSPVGAPCFDDNQLTWVQNTVSLAGYIGQPDVRIRYRLATDTSVNRAGFTFDDFRITATRLQDGLSPVPGAGPLALGVSAWPNPFNPSTTVAFTVPRSGLVELRIYDLRGRMVRTLETGHLEAGAHRRTWDGRDTAGSPVGSGVYFAQARVGAERAVTKLMLVK